MNIELFSTTSKQSQAVFLDYLSKIEYSAQDKEIINRAIKFINFKHNNQFRKSGEPYVNHLFAVGSKCIELNLPPFVVVSALLHDTIEDTDTTYEELKDNFGVKVSRIVRSLSKSNIENKIEADTQTHLKVFAGSINNPYVLIIKLIDRLHNIKTIDSLNEWKQIRKAAETREFYIPLAYRMGMNELRSELEDACFKIENKEAYYNLVNKINSKKIVREQMLVLGEEKIINKLSEFIDIDSIRMESRVKSLHSIYNTMEKKDKRFDQLTDLYAFRIITNSVMKCYEILAILHTNFLCDNNRFKDYISVPKNNNYQSIHTSIVIENLGEVEVQIRTEEMDAIAKNGIASHYNYKNDNIDYIIKQDKKAFSMLNGVAKNEVVEVQTLVDAFSNNNETILVYSPKGEAFYLPKYSTVLDYAFYVHPELAKRILATHINGKEADIFMELKQGNQVELIVSKKQITVERDWLSHAKTSLARREIKKALVEQLHQVEIDKGRDILKYMFEKSNITDFEHLIKSESFENVVSLLKCVSKEDLFGQVYNKKISPELILTEYETLKFIESKTLTDQSRDALKINNLGLKIEESAITHPSKRDVMVYFASCCLPVIKDPIVGLDFEGIGVVIHHKRCSNINLKDDVNVDSKYKWRPLIGFTNTKWNFDVRIHAESKIIEENILNLFHRAFIGGNVFLKKMDLVLEKERNCYQITCKITVRKLAQVDQVLRIISSNPNITKAKRLIEEV